MDFSACQYLSAYSFHSNEILVPDFSFSLDEYESTSSILKEFKVCASTDFSLYSLICLNDFVIFTLQISFSSTFRRKSFDLLPVEVASAPEEVKAETKSSEKAYDEKHKTEEWTSEALVVVVLAPPEEVSGGGGGEGLEDGGLDLVQPSTPVKQEQFDYHHLYRVRFSTLDMFNW